MKSRENAVLFLASYFAYASIYVARLNLTVASPVMRSENIMTVAGIGVMGGLFFLTYSVGQLLNGILGDIFHPKFMVMTGLFLVASANLCISTLPPSSAIIALWGVNGFAQSMLWGPLLRTVSTRFSGEKRSFIGSLLATSIGVGSVAGIFLATSAIRFGNLKCAFLFPGCMSLLAFLCVLLFFRSPGKSTGAQRASLLSLLGRPQLMILMIPAFLHGVLKDNINLWMVSYFTDTFSIDIQKSSFYVFMVPVMILAGRIIYPFLYKLCGRNEHLVSITALSAAALSLIPLCTAHISPLTAAVCLSIAAASVSSVNTSFLTVYPMNYQKSGNVSTVVGLMDFSTYLGAGISSAFYGWMLEYTTYPVMFLSWIGLAVLAVLILAGVMKPFSQLSS